MEYLGHRLSKEGVSMVPEYIQTEWPAPETYKEVATFLGFTDNYRWPVPETGKEVARFLGFAGYYRMFIPQYSALTNRLNGIKKAEIFV